MCTACRSRTRAGELDGDDVYAPVLGHFPHVPGVAGDDGDPVLPGVRDGGTEMRVRDGNSGPPQQAGRGIGVLWVERYVGDAQPIDQRPGRIGTIPACPDRDRDGHRGADRQGARHPPVHRPDLGDHAAMLAARGVGQNLDRSVVQQDESLHAAPLESPR